VDKVLSIVVAAYNVERFIKNCIRSIILIPENEKAKIEIIIINDGSTDSTPEILQDYAQKHCGFLLVYSKVNGGLSDARNYGLKKATGKFIWFVDGDDYIETSNIPALIEILTTAKSEYLIFKANRVNDQKKVIGCFYLEKKGHNQDESIDFKFTSIIDCLNKHMSWLRIYKRSLIAHQLFPVGITHEDIHFDLNILTGEPVVSYQDLIIYNHYFDNPESITNTMNFAKQLHVLWVYSDLIDENNSFYGSDRINMELEKICVYGLLKRIMYILSLAGNRKEQYILFNRYSEVIKRHEVIFGYLDVNNRLDLWDKSFKYFVLINSFSIARVIARLRVMF